MCMLQEWTLGRYQSVLKSVYFKEEFAMQKEWLDFRKDYFCFNVLWCVGRKIKDIYVYEINKTPFQLPGPEGG